MSDTDLLRQLIDARQSVQKVRVAFNNRIKAIERGADEASERDTKMLMKYHDRLKREERELDEDIKELAQDLPIIERMIEVKGIGYLLAAKVVSMINIEIDDTVSSLWRYAGYGVDENGERDRPIKGEKLKYNKRLKAACYLVGTSLLKSRGGSSYRETYDKAREYYDANRPDWTKGHKHNAALRKMTKLWLSHLWLEWRKLKGLSITEPYVQEKLGHTHIITPQQMGWPE